MINELNRGRQRRYPVPIARGLLDSGCRENGGPGPHETTGLTLRWGRAPRVLLITFDLPARNATPLLLAGHRPGRPVKIFVGRRFDELFDD
jgi:hypothetical protein